LLEWNILRRCWSAGFLIENSGFDESESTQLDELGAFYGIEKE